jgi:anti-sigma factor ChrR (cupin superfamily)
VSAHVDELLFELACGTLGADERRRALGHLASCPRCAAEAAAVAELAASLPAGLAAPSPPPALRERLMRSVTPGRFERFVARVAAALEVTAERARELLAGIDDPASWSPSPVAWSRLYHLTAGPRLVEAGTVTGFVRVAPGKTYHIHVGREHVLVVQGGFRDGDGGADVVTGQDSYKEPGTAHSLTAHEGEELVYLAVVERGVEFDPPFEF